MYKTWRLGNSILGFVCPLKQIAFGVGLRWFSHKHDSLFLYSIYVWLDIGPLHVWFGWDIPSRRNSK